MKDQDKNDLLEFGSYVLALILIALAIMTNATVWNAAANGNAAKFFGWVAGFNFIAEGFGIYKYTMFIRNKFKSIRAEKKAQK